MPPRTGAGALATSHRRLRRLSTAAGASPRASRTAPAAVAADRLQDQGARSRRRAPTAGLRRPPRHPGPAPRSPRPRARRGVERAGAGSPGPWRGRLERSERAFRVAVREAEERQPRLRVRTDLSRAPEALLRTGQVAHPSTDLAGLVDRLRGCHGIEAHQLFRRPRRLCLGLGPCAAEPRDLRAVDPAHPGERRFGRERLAPGASRLAPLVRSADVGDLQAGPDHVAVDDAGEVRGELAGDDACHRLIEQRHAAVRLPERMSTMPWVWIAIAIRSGSRNRWASSVARPSELLRPRQVAAEPSDRRLAR